MTTEVFESRQASIGDLVVQRALPNKNRRTVGAWCFLDHLGPVSLDPDRSIDVAPHPHIGLHTITWLFEGSLVHRDSLGTEQLLVRGELNVMSAGGGVVHSEERPEEYGPLLHGAQLWVAQPETERHGAPGFTHVAHVPEVELPNAHLHVFAGAWAGGRAPTQLPNESAAAEIRLRPGRSEFPLSPNHEHGLFVVNGAVRWGTNLARAGQFLVQPPGAGTMVLEAAESAVVIVLSGEPWTDKLYMWWNFVARTPEEVTEAYRAWVEPSSRFGSIDSTLARVIPPPPPWLRAAGSATSE